MRRFSHEHTPLLPSQPRPSASGFVATLSQFFGAAPSQAGTDLQVRTIQRNDDWLRRLGVGAEARAIAAQDPALQRAIGALLDADPPVLELTTAADGASACAFVEPGPTRDTLESLVRIGQALFDWKDPVAARLLVTACEAARLRFPDREADLLHGCGLALQHSQASLPPATLVPLCERVAELVDMGFVSKDDWLLFEAAACRSPQSAAYGLGLGLRRVRADLKALSQAQQPGPPSAVAARLGQDIEQLHRQACAQGLAPCADDAIQLLQDLVALTKGTPDQGALSATLDRLRDTSERLFTAPRTHEQWRLHLGALARHRPELPWSTFKAHLDFVAQAFPRHHTPGAEAALCLDWVCAKPEAAATRLPELWACIAAQPAPGAALSRPDTERLLKLVLALPAEPAIEALTAYRRTLRGSLGGRERKALRHLVDAHAGLAGRRSPLAVLNGFVDELRRHGVAPVPEWDFLVQRLVVALLARDRSPAMADALAWCALVLTQTQAPRDPLAALDSAIGLVHALRQALHAARPSTGGAAADEEAAFLSRFSTHLEHQIRFGGQDFSTVDGPRRHAQLLLGACLHALADPHDPVDAPVDTTDFAEVYRHLVRARLAQQAGDDSARERVERTVQRHKAVLKRKGYLQTLDRVDPAWKQYSPPLQAMVEALKDTQDRQPT